jgi:cytochrome bd-type quinol oxidase subunit 1
MQTGKSIPSPKTARARILWLVGVHFVVGLSLGTIRAATGPGFDLLTASFVGLVFSQTSLLGIWGGSGTNRWWIRLVGVSIGIAYLGPFCGFCLDDPGREKNLIVALATFVVAAVLLVSRCFGFRTRLNSDQNISAKEMQFSIRHLMILTLVVACLLALAKWQQRYLDLDDWPLLAVIAAVFATVGLAAAWAVLGVKRPLIGVPLLLAVAVGAAYVVETVLDSPEMIAICIAMTVTEAISLTVSLLVVRSSGYRLRRRSARRPGSDPGEIEHSI